MAIGMSMLSGLCHSSFPPFSYKAYDECQRYKGKREEEKSLFSSRIFYDKYNYNEKKDKDSLRIYTWTTAQRLC